MLRIDNEQYIPTRAAAAYLDLSPHSLRLLSLAWHPKGPEDRPRCPLLAPGGRLLSRDPTATGKPELGSEAVNTPAGHTLSL